MAYNNAKIISRKKTLAGAFLGCLVCSTTVYADRPNIVLIVADDLGYTDLGVTGGEIDTPRLDELANTGLMISDFQVAPQCSPSRAMLLSGTDSHLAGLGQMAEWNKAPNQEGRPGYVGYLNDDVVSVSETLQNAGYHTYMAGKWHLGRGDAYGPHSRGFESSFVLETGAASHFDIQKGYDPAEPLAPYLENGERVDSLPNNFFSTDFYTDKIIEYIGNNEDSDKPFFAYVAYTAPHWPLQAPDSWIDKYEGRYDEGYEKLTDERIAKAKSLGLFPDGSPANGFKPNAIHKNWDSLTEEEKAYSIRTMEIYAAMVANMDYNIGRLFDYLKSTGEYDNTMFVFMSDNGPHPGTPANMWQRYENGETWKATYDLSLENLGKPNSFAGYNEWSQASAGPFRHFKQMVTEGGIRSPLIVKYPGGVEGNLNTTAFTTVMDLAPTFLDVANTEHPTTYNGREVHPHKGKSLMPIIMGDADEVHEDDYIAGVEIDQKQAVRKGGWKLVWIKKGFLKTNEWELFNIADDPGEMHNLVEEEPEKFEEMKQAWDTYVKKSGVIIAPLERE